MARRGKLRRAGFWRWPYDVRETAPAFRVVGRRRAWPPGGANPQPGFSRLCALPRRAWPRSSSGAAPPRRRVRPERGAVLLGMAAILLVVPAAAYLPMLRE
jgi:hypothetical protein